jgi:gamma-glutamyl-gamma-aminobutyrate hydrolase PuuD
VTKSSEITIGERLSYEQHISDHSQTELFKISRRKPSHYVVARDDLLYGGENKIPDYTSVNSMHHQYLHLHRADDQLYHSTKVTPHMWVSAWTGRGLDKDDEGVVCEGFIIRDWTPSPIAGVQWHPEEMMDIQLIQHHFGVSKKESNASSGKEKSVPR